MSKRKLSSKEIQSILNIITPCNTLPRDIAKSLVKKTRQEVKKQLENIIIYPEILSELRKEIERQYYTSLIQSGESVGIICAQSIGEKQTQGNLDKFHKAGSAGSSGGSISIQELLDATKRPKNPLCYIYFTEGNDTIEQLRHTIGSSIVEINMNKIVTNFSIHLDKKREKWHDAFDLLYSTDYTRYTDCLVLNINVDILFEYRIKLKDISDVINEEYEDMYCIFSPDCIGEIHLFVDTDVDFDDDDLTEMKKIKEAQLEETHELPDEALDKIDEVMKDYILSEKDIDNGILFINEDNKTSIYLEEVVLYRILNTHIAGIKGIKEMFFLQENDKWYIETDNSTYSDKQINENAISQQLYKNVMMLSFVDKTRSILVSIWDVYYTLGIEATRQFLFEQYKSIMAGINDCHILLLVDRMCFKGTICSINRYTTKKDDTETLSKATFEETIPNLCTSALFGKKDSTNGISASIICGKRGRCGTGISELIMREE